MKMRLLAALLLPINGSLAAQARTLHVRDDTINYDVAGKGPAVVFIDGWTHNISIWDDQVAACESRYQVVRYDSRGFGRSTGFANAYPNRVAGLVLYGAFPEGYPAPPETARFLARC